MTSGDVCMCACVRWLLDRSLNLFSRIWFSELKRDGKKKMKRNGQRITNTTSAGNSEKYVT